MKNLLSPPWASALAALVGAATWWYVAAVTHRREAWDAELYFSMAFPLIALLASILSFVVPSKPWRWAMIPFAAQAIVAWVQNPTGNLMPLGLIMFAVLGGLCAVPAACVAWLRRRLLPA